MRRKIATSLVALAGLAGLVALVPSASAEVPILNYGIKPNSTQAGGHPDLQISFYLQDDQLQQKETGLNSPCDCANPRIVTVHAPPGLVGNPHATPRCSAADFGATSCPSDSQIGFVNGAVAFGPEGVFSFVAPLFNLQPHSGEPGLVGFQVFGATFFEVISTRTGSDYGLDTKVFAWGGLPVRLINQIYFGVPASPKNDRLRFKFPGLAPLLTGVCDTDGNPVTPYLTTLNPAHNNPLAPLSGPDSFQKDCDGFGFIDNWLEQVPTPSSSPEIPFIESPTTCGVPLESTIDVVAFDGEVTHSSAPYPATDGCDQLSFNPSLAAKPTSTEADSPSGVDIDLTVPETQSPNTPAPSEIRGATVTLPEGFSVNANAADGKTACVDAEAKFGTEDQAQCPDFSKIGTLEVHTALLPGPLPGYVYLGQPLPGERYRVFLVADGFGVHIKLPGTVTPDPVTGQVKISFVDLPQTPFEEFKMHIFGSERGVLATPTHCGTYAVRSTFTPWDSALPNQSATQFFTIDAGPNGTPCPGSSRPFSPTFEASSVGNTAGSHTPFSVNLKREDGDQFLTGLNVTTPPGFSATLKGIPYCPDATIAQFQSPLYSGLAELNSSICPAASQIGTATTGAGAGSKPLIVKGKVFLAGPYKGAPVSLIVVVPAVSGPYDLGNVAVRVATYVDPVTARVSAVSDPLPQIFGGIPLRTRGVRVDLDRPNFTLNPTNCDSFSVDAMATGDQGATAPLSSHYQVANCASLEYAPTLALKLTGGVNRRGHPAIHALLSAKPGEANTRRVSVTLPKGELLDNSHIGTVCTRVDFARKTCPADSRLGRAEVTTPLLDQPLVGSVYLRSSQHELPDMAIDLRGQFDIEAVGRIDSVNSRLRTTFETVPDAPISQIALDLAGGGKGLLVNSDGLCGVVKKATVRMVGQNGKRLTRRVELNASCGKSQGHAKHKRHAKRVHRARAAE